MTVDPNRIRCIDPLVSPQYPFDEPPRPPERSEPRYASLSDHEARIALRDDITLAADVIEIMYSQKYPFDGRFYHERSAWPRLDRIKIPSYFGCGWYMNERWRAENEWPLERTQWRELYLAARAPACRAH